MKEILYHMVCILNPRLAPEINRVEINIVCLFFILGGKTNAYVYGEAK